MDLVGKSTDQFLSKEDIFATWLNLNKFYDVVLTYQRNGQPPFVEISDDQYLG